MVLKNQPPNPSEKAQKEVESAQWAALWMTVWLFGAVGSSVCIIFLPYLRLAVALLFYGLISTNFGLLSCLETRKPRDFLFYGFVVYGGLIFGPLGLSWPLIEFFGLNPLASIVFAAFIPAFFAFDSFKDLYRTASYLGHLSHKRRRIPTLFFVEIFLFSLVGTSGSIIILWKRYPTLDSWESMMTNLAPLQIVVLVLFVSVSCAILGAWLYVSLSEPSWKRAEFSAEIDSEIDVLGLSERLRGSRCYDVEYALLGGWLRWRVYRKYEYREYDLDQSGTLHVKLFAQQKIDKSIMHLKKELTEEWTLRNLTCRVDSGRVQAVKNTVSAFFRVPLRIVALLFVFVAFLVSPIPLVMFANRTFITIPWDIGTFQAICFASLGGIGFAFSQLIISSIALPYRSAKKGITSWYAARNIIFISLVVFSLVTFVAGTARSFLEIPVLQLTMISILLYNFFDCFRSESLFYRVFSKTLRLPVGFIKAATALLVVLIPFLFDVLDVYVNAILLLFWVCGFSCNIRDAAQVRPTA